jgi:hypothetical protein
LERRKDEATPLLVVADEEKVYQRRVLDDGGNTRVDVVAVGHAPDDLVHGIGVVLDEILMSVSTCGNDLR